MNGEPVARRLPDVWESYTRALDKPMIVVYSGSLSLSEPDRERFRKTFEDAGESLERTIDRMSESLQGRR